jgi:nucleoside phosphorylase
MRGIPVEILHPLRKALRECTEFTDISRLRSVFNDKRLRVWKSKLPEDSNPAWQVNLTISYLTDKRHRSGDENALSILLRVLSENRSPGDGLYQRLVDLEDRVSKWNEAQLPEASSKPSGLDGMEDKFDFILEEQKWFVKELPRSIEVNRDQIRDIRDTIDVVLFTVNDREFRAVMHLLKAYPGRSRVLRFYEGSGTYYIGRFGQFNTAVTRCRMGSIEANSVRAIAPDAFRLWHPRAMVMVGVAFGKDPAKQKIGDVLVASQVISYEPQRVGRDQIVMRGAHTPSTSVLLNRFENNPRWRFLRPDGKRCSIIVGPVLSGEKLVDDPDYHRQLFRSFPQAVGGEMEGAGLAAAATDLHAVWILAKAICDWGDGKKNDKFQPLAAASAASLVHNVLSQKTVLSSIPKPREV